VSLGKLSELDQSEAELQLDIRLAELDQHALALSEAAARLRLLLGSGRIGSTMLVSAADSLGWDDEGAERIRAEARSRLGDALLFQPDIAIRRAELEKEQIMFDYRRDQRLPELNARARLGYQGLGDSPNASLERLSGQEFPTWSLSLEFRLPLLGDVSAANAVEEAKLRKELAASQLAAAERETSISVEALFQRVLTYMKQADNARAVSGFKRQLLDVELKRFDAGKSDIRRIYELEQGLSEARVQELESYALLRKAASNLSAASGTTLRDKGLERLERGQFILVPLLGLAGGT
jgi:outer membrane protein TolC